MAGIVLVMKPPFLFPYPEPPYLNNASDRTLEAAMGQGGNATELVNVRVVIFQRIHFNLVICLNFLEIR